MLEDWSRAPFRRTKVVIGRPGEYAPSTRIQFGAAVSFQCIAPTRTFLVIWDGGGMERGAVSGPDMIVALGAHPVIMDPPNVVSDHSIRSLRPHALKGNKRRTRIHVLCQTQRPGILVRLPLRHHVIRNHVGSECHDSDTKAGEHAAEHSTSGKHGVFAPGLALRPGVTEQLRILLRGHLSTNK